MAYDSNEWRHLNAYADGELPEKEARAFEQRLAEKPELRRDLEQLRDLKRKLARMQPLPAAQAGELPAAAPVRKRPMATAIAAALVAIAILSTVAAILVLRPTSWLEHARALHAEQSRRAFVVEEHHVARTVSSGQTLEFRPPDLTASRLYLVDIATPGWGDRGAISVHYRGLQGCRLTIVAIEAGGDIDPSLLVGDAGSMIRTWLHDGFAFAVIADGMDPKRFRSVADYAQTAIVAPPTDDRELRTAMAETHRNARRCA